GTGIVTVVPDVAVLSLGVEARESTVEEAMDEAADAMDAVMAKLRAKGVADKDIKTEWFSIYPITEWIEDGHEVIVGYRVSNTVSIKIRDVDAAGEIIDAAAQAGGDLIRVQGVSFTVDDPSLYYVEARQEAMTDAKAKAQQLASLAGVGLGKAYYISESSGYYPIYADYAWESRGGDVAATTQISPGEMDITLSVQVAFAIQ
ncbi:MAG: SIMPL domain-containing protein, partial [Chloroflexota bacterium]|nr:SIMPL domain-containing protein [Chloroflexota bacterium]